MSQSEFITAQISECEDGRWRWYVSGPGFGCEGYNETQKEAEQSAREVWNEEVNRVEQMT